MRRGKRRTASSHPDIAEAEAGGARRRQSNPNLGMTGQSNPPPDDLSAPPTQNTQFTLPLQQDQVTQPQGRPLPEQTRAPVDTAQTFDNPGQQYPQPGIRPTTRRRAPTRQRSTSIADQPGFLYPGVAQPLVYQPYPVDWAPRQRRALLRRMRSWWRGWCLLCGEDTIRRRGQLDHR